MDAPSQLLAVPNVSEGRDPAVIDAIAHAFSGAPGVRLLDAHSDPDHHRSVFTLAGPPGGLSQALFAGASEALARVRVGPAWPADHIGQHPHVGALDVVPLVYLDASSRGAACAEALVVAHEIGERLQVPVFLYGELASGRARAELRRGGIARIASRIQSGELSPDFGPRRIHATAGATLVAAREPLVAFNLVLAPPASLSDARRIAALIREGGTEGMPGLRAIGVSLSAVADSAAGADFAAGAETLVGSDLASGADRLLPQVSMNVERPLELPLRDIVQAVSRHAPVAHAELVGLAPRAAFAGFPENVPIPGFDPRVHLIENALGF